MPEHSYWRFYPLTDKYQSRILLSGISPGPSISSYEKIQEENWSWNRLPHVAYRAEKRNHCRSLNKFLALSLWFIVYLAHKVAINN
jgi:hypothetical protein